MAEKMIFCKACGKEIAKSAKTCPQCGKKNKRPFWVTLLIIVGIIIAISTISNLLNKNSSNSSVSKSGRSSTSNDTAEARTTAIEVSPSQLFADYKANEVNADNLYKGKLLKVTGTIKSIGKDIRDEPYITFDSGDIITSVQVYFMKSEQNKLADLSSGQKLTIIGTCGGKLMNVFIRNSSIE